MSVDAFVAGATGFTGRELVRVLAESGRRVVAHVRPDSSRLGEWRQRFEAVGALVDASPWNEAQMTETLRTLAPAVVYALLGTTRARGRATGDDYESVDYGLTALLLRAAVASGVRPRFVYLSSVGASPKTTNAYLRVRGRLEREIRESGLPFTVARPSFITGPGRDDSRPGERVGASVADAGLAVLGALGARRVASRYRSTSNVTLARALGRVGFDPGFEGRVAEGDDLRG
ncbi:MAG: NAD(P)H-binding protein [Polyangiaceae bacterium]|nr:NAD(P)H-binding protein [Polyangiaceae bacterium]